MCSWCQQPSISSFTSPEAFYLSTREEKSRFWCYSSAVKKERPSYVGGGTQGTYYWKWNLLSLLPMLSKIHHVFWLQHGTSVLWLRSWYCSSSPSPPLALALRTSKRNSLFLLGLDWQDPFPFWGAAGCMLPSPLLPPSFLLSLAK